MSDQRIAYREQRANAEAGRHACVACRETVGSQYGAEPSFVFSLSFPLPIEPTFSLSFLRPDSSLTSLTSLAPGRSRSLSFTLSHSLTRFTPFRSSISLFPFSHLFALAFFLPPLSLSLSLSHSPVIQAYIRSTRSPCFFFVHRHARFECRSSLVLHLICTKGAEFPCRVILRHVFGARARFRLSSVRSSVAHFRGSRKRNRIYIKLDKRHVIDNENA